MAITNLQTLNDALARAISYTVNKSISTSTLSSGWRSASLPAAGAIPTIPTICTKDTLGAVALINAPDGMENYLLELSCGTTSASQASALIADRLMHMGGLSGSVIGTPQTVGLNVADPELADRIGSSNLSDVEWWLEGYATTGSTSKPLQINTTYTDASTDTLLATLPASMPSGRMVQIIPATGKRIQSVDSVLLAENTGASGNFGVTALRVLAQATPRVMETVTLDWAKTAIQRIPRDACLMVYNYNASGTITNIMFLRIGAA